MDRIIRLFVPVLATALVWTAVFVGVSSSEVSSKSTDAEEVTVAPRATVSATVERIEDSRSGFEPEPSRLRTCELLGPDSLPIPSTLSGMVVDNATGDTLFDAEASTPHPTASVVKIVTATAALRVLGPDHRLTTTVVAGGAGEIFLVGGGDVTLTRAPGSNYYDSEASLQSLATQTLEKLNRDNLETVVVRSDGSRYEDFPVWDSTWRSGSASLGFVAPVTALQVDGDRDQPLRRLSPRSMNPELRAIEWFAEVTRAAGPQLNVRVGQPDTAPPGAIVLAQVDSAPVGELIGIMLRDSDNSLSEVLAREVALSLGTTNIGSALLEGASLGSWEPSDGSVHGGSGLSSQTTLSHDVITRLLRNIDRDVELSAIRDNLPIAAQTGSLRNRYLAVSPELAGRVEAKTGSIQGTRSLAGYLLAEDGSELIFSFNASGAGVDNQSRDEIDRLLANVSRCGSNLVG